MESAPATNTGYGKSVISGFVNLLMVVAALLIFYWMFKAFYGDVKEQGVVVEASKIVANQGVKTYTNQAPIYEGGEYTTNFWVYVSGWRTNQGTRKHVLEIGGTNYATLIVSLGAFKNSLQVRVHSRQMSTTTTKSGADCSGADCSGAAVGGVTTASPVGGTTDDISLTTADKGEYFKPMSVDNGLMDSNTLCDIDEIDLQRWVQVTVVLNGRTCDVYIDGKLMRSCVLPSFYKVDPTGQKLKLTDYAGFDGYVSNVSTYNYSLTPDKIYHMYMKGPQSESFDLVKYFTSFFRSPA
jgi:hypothetical protein